MNAQLYAWALLIAVVVIMTSIAIAELLAWILV